MNMHPIGQRVIDRHVSHWQAAVETHRLQHDVTTDSADKQKAWVLLMAATAVLVALDEYRNKSE